MRKSFVLQSRYEAMVAKLSDKQAGVLFKAILHYVATNEKPESLCDGAVAMAFDFICQDIDYNCAKYEQICAMRAEIGRKGGLAKKSKSTNCLSSANPQSSSKTKHNDVDVVVDVDAEVEDDINTLTAPANAAQGVSDSSSTSPKPKTSLQVFSNQVLARFESIVQTDVQKGIWFKRNCRCLSDILKFCEGNIPLALQTISVCARRLEKAGLTGGYEAVCRNLPEYYAQAQKELREASYER